MRDRSQEEKRLRIVSVMGLLLLLGTLCAIFLMDKGDDTRFESGIENFSQGWYAEYENKDGKPVHQTITPPCTLSDSVSEEGINLYNTVPDIKAKDTGIFFEAYHQHVTVYIDGKLREEYGNKDSVIFGRVVPRAYMPIYLNPDDSGKTIRIHIDKGPYDKISRSVHEMFIGNERQLNRYLLDTYIVDILFGVIFIIIGIIWIIMFTVLYKYFGEYASVFYLGYFAIFMGGYVLCNSRGRQLFSARIAFCEKAGYIFLAVLIIPVLHFIEIRQKHRYKKSNYTMCFLFSLNAIAIFLLDLFKVVDMYKSVISTMALIVIATIYTFYCIFMDLKSGYRDDSKAVFWAYSIMGIAGIIKCIMSILPNDLEKFSNLILYMGAFCMMIIMGGSYIFNWISEEKHKREEENASKTKNTFLANMSHEIRTPITAILGMDEMILRESQDENIIGYANKIRNSSKILLSLINDILDFSKIESGKMELVNAEYELVPLLSDVVTMIKTNAERKNLEFIVNIDENSPTKLYGDDIRIRQILINILNNAVKYTKQGKVILNIKCNRLRVDSKEKAIFEVHIIDTGVGIKKEDIGKLFEAFGRLDLKYNRSVEGTGLGMSITSHFLGMMESKLEIDSEYGKGSDFHFILEQSVLDPTAIGDFKKAYSKYESHKDSDTSNFVAPDAKILIVDDNEMNLEVVRGLLKETRVQVTTVDRGQRAIELFKENDFDMAFIDHMMPGMDGIETLKHIRTYEASTLGDKGAKVPIVVLTANAISGAKEMYMEKGFNDYLAKPIVIKDLLSCLKKYLPANLIIPVSSTGEKVSDAALTELTQENKEADEFNEYYLSRYGINIDEGIKFAAGKAGKYKIVLTAYAKFDEPRRHKLIDYIDRKDMDSYAIEVHALKGNARSIGAATLGDIAYEHEKRSKAKDYKYIVNNFGLIRDEMDIVLKGVTELLADNRLLERNTETVAKPAAQAASSVQSSLKQANPILDSDSKGIIINAAKKKKAAEIRTAIEDYDRTLALDEINEWIEQEPLEEVVTFLKEVADNLREFEFEKSLNLLKSKVF